MAEEYSVFETHLITQLSYAHHAFQRMGIIGEIGSDVWKAQVEKLIIKVTKPSIADGNHEVMP